MSAAQHRSPFPAMPPSLSAGRHETRDDVVEDVSRSTPHTGTEITPYLGLRSRLSQAWINKWTILLFLVLVRILIAIASLHNELGSAKREALSACTAVESVGSTMASMPHYMSQGVNELTANGVEKAINGLMSMLLLSITGVEEIVVFYINMLTSTYVCLITLAVSGSLHVALKVVDDVGNFLNRTLGDIGKDIHNDINNFETDLNKFIGGLNSIPAAFGSKAKIPTIDANASLSKLDNLELPGNLDQDLSKINNSIPTFAQVNNFTNSAIRLPFEEVKKLINESMIAYKFNRSLLPVPQKEQLHFCSDNNGISHFFDDLADIINGARRVFIGILTVAAIALIFVMAYREIRRWRTMQQRARLVGDHSFDPIDVVYINTRPYTSTAGIKASSHFSSTKSQLLARWVIAYATSVPALLVLSLGVTGLLACLCQYILLRLVTHEVPALAQEVGVYADKVVHALNNASESWATGTNAVITHTNNDINHDVFGWVNTTTGALNETLNTFVNGMTDVLNATFGGTVLYDPVTEVMNCLIGLKIAGIQKGLTWVSDHAHVDFPLLNNSTFSLGAAASLASNNSGNPQSDSFLASPSTKAGDDITAALVRVTSHLYDAIRTEALISTAVLCLWLLVALMGIFRAIYLSFRREKQRGEGGPSNAGDIPMQDTRRPYTPQPPSNREGPMSRVEREIGMEMPREAAPAYSPPHAGVRLNYAENGEGGDGKVGWAGQRPPPGVGTGHVRSSSYGVVGGGGNEKGSF